MSSIILLFLRYIFLGGSKIRLSQALMWSLAAISGKTLRTTGFNK